ncbi:MAG: hypothetical protein V3W34_17925 [Phycisphaerae bacterium]
MTQYVDDVRYSTLRDSDTALTACQTIPCTDYRSAPAAPVLLKSNVSTQPAVSSRKTQFENANHKPRPNIGSGAPERGTGVGTAVVSALLIITRPLKEFG